MSLTNLGLNRGPLVRSICGFSIHSGESFEGVFMSDFFLPTGVESEDGRLLSIFLR